MLALIPQVRSQIQKLQRRVVWQRVGPHYQTMIVSISRRFLYIEREHAFKAPNEDLDIHGSQWSVAFFDTNSGTSELERMDKRVRITGRQMLFIPPFSILKWHVYPQRVKWGAFLIRSEKLPIWQEPMLFDAPENLPSIITEAELIDFINGLEGGRVVGFQNRHSKVAEKTKDLLDKAFPQSPSISDIATQIGIQLPSLDREFKRTYNISPREYSVRQRTLATYLNSLFGDKRFLKDIASEMGFIHMGNFAKQCQKYLNAKPSQLKTY